MSSNSLPKWTPWILVGIQTVVIIIILQSTLFLNLMRGTLDPKMVSIQNQQEALKTDMNHTPEALKTDMTHPREKIEKVCQEAEGDRFHIFCPFYITALSPQLLASPEDWLNRLKARFSWLDTIVTSNDKRTLLARSQAAYYEFLENYVTGLCFSGEEYTIMPRVVVEKDPLDVEKRKAGLDWTYLGDTMTGSLRLNSVKKLLHDVIQNEISGDFIETGVWRGGMSIFARGILQANNQTHRKSFVCDSFRGLPPGERDLDPKDKNWNLFNYLEVSEVIVAENFKAAGLLDPNVIFAKGFFNDTMPEVAKMTKSLAIMRLDGDMYESTVDVLYHLYEKLSIGGYVIMDDWYGYPSKTACEDFFKAHNISPAIIAVDALSAYWQKTEQVNVQYWRYEQLNFKAGA